jgi:hypothetical protein
MSMARLPTARTASRNRSCVTCSRRDHLSSSRALLMSIRSGGAPLRAPSGGVFMASILV